MGRVLINDVMDELGAALGAISGLKVFAFGAQRITPPAAMVGWPDTYEFDSTGARGADHLVIPVYVLVGGQIEAKSARDAMSQYVSGAGVASVKAAVEAASYTACDSVRVQSCEFGTLTVAGVEYLAATFQIDVIGAGA